MDVDYQTLVAFSKYSRNAKLDNFLSIPNILYDGIMFLYDHLKTPSLFRKTSNVSDLNNIIDYYISNNKFPDNVDVHLVAGTIIYFLKRVSSPLISQELFELFVSLYFVKYTSTTAYNSNLLSAITNIPTPYRTILEFILSFCNKLILPGINININ